MYDSEVKPYLAVVRKHSHKMKDRQDFYIRRQVLFMFISTEATQFFVSILGE